MLKVVDSNKWVEVRPIHCHKRLEENTLVRRLCIKSEDKRYCEILIEFNPEKLRFFFDHEIDHLPGMLEVCAFRQCSLALAHLVYLVPQDYVTLLEGFKVDLYNYGELDERIIVQSTLIGRKDAKNKITLEMEGLMVQNGYPVARMVGKLVALSPSFASKIRTRKFHTKEVGRTHVD